MCRGDNSLLVLFEESASRCWAEIPFSAAQQKEVSEEGTLLGRIFFGASSSKVRTLLFRQLCLDKRERQILAPFPAMFLRNFNANLL